MRWVLLVALHPRRLLVLIGGAVVFSTYVWIAAVRAVPGVRARKAGRREAWRRGERKPPRTA